MIAQLLYDTGMRLLEALGLRVKDVEFARREIVIREGKGNKDRVTVLPENLIGPLQRQLQKVKALHKKDLEAGFGRVYLPHALAVKYPYGTCGSQLGVAIPVSFLGSRGGSAPRCHHWRADRAPPTHLPRVGAACRA